MCGILKITTAGYYKNINRIMINKLDKQTMYDEKIKTIFISSKKTYGCRRIKSALADQGIIKSTRYIRRVMKRLSLISLYSKKSFKKPRSKGVNKDESNNLLKRDFKTNKLNQILTSDLTYMNVNHKHSYVCFIIDLATREIVGYSIGEIKSTELVLEAFKNIKFNLDNVEIFHTDRGLEFKNNKINNLLVTNKINHSLSEPGSPYDNAVSESTFKTFKVTSPDTYVYESLFELKHDVKDFVNWYNTFRKHSSIGYKTPVQYRMQLNSLYVAKGTLHLSEV